MGLLSNIYDIFPDRGPELLSFSTVLTIILIANMHSYDSYAQIMPAVNHPLINSTVAQDTLTQDLVSSNTTSANTHSNTTSVSLPEVKITSHQEGQLVPVGTLAISGLSSDDLITTCDVYVILNNDQPYQQVASTAEEPRDFSSWNFTFMPSYSLIKEGSNKMTAKITCTNDKIAENVTKFNSLNVTGVVLNSNVTPFPSSYIVYDNNTTAKPIVPASHQSQIVPAQTTSVDRSPQQNTGKTIAQPNNQITPAPYLTEEEPNQYSSSTQGNQEEMEQQEKILTSVDEDNEDNEQRNSIDSAEASEDMKNIVNEFTEGVEERIEHQIEEMFTSKIPFQLATPFEAGN